MHTLFVGDLFSWIVVVWAIFSIVLTFVMYKHISKNILILLGTLFGGIIFAFGVSGLFSGFNGFLREMAHLQISEIQGIKEGIRLARIPFSVGTIATIIYFIVLAIAVTIKKGALKKWSLWVGWFIFFFFTFIISNIRKSMFTALVKGITKSFGFGDTLPEQLELFLKAGKVAIFTSILLSIVYLLIAIFGTIYKKREKKIPEPAPTNQAEETPIIRKEKDK